MAAPPPKTLRLLCVDDNDLVAEALRRRVEQEPALVWVGLVNDGNQACRRVCEATPDVVLMDIDMPGVDTFALIREISRECPDARVVMFSGHVNREYVERALDCGAWGYLSKNEDVARLLEGVCQAGRGEIALSKEVEAVLEGGGR